MIPSLTIFLYLALAAWRLANLVANEDGPFRIFRMIRNASEILCERSSVWRFFGLHELLSCEYCNSVWIGAGLMWLYVQFPTIAMYVALPFALSTVVILIKYVHQFLRGIAP